MGTKSRTTEHFPDMRERGLDRRWVTVVIRSGGETILNCSAPRGRAGRGMPLASGHHLRIHDAEGLEAQEA